MQTGKVKKFSTFSGVFVPDVLTILGVIMYLRLGWVVGNAGFLGAVIIIVLAKAITFCTGLSMSSITTNIRIGAGGAYSIISKSLGLEAGGSVGIPLYIAQTLSAALYLIGFTESWLRVFPSHPFQLVIVSAWAVLLIISYISAHFAIKIQYLIMTIIGISLFSFAFSKSQPVEHIEMIGTFENAQFWQVFAIFFPAVTGIMAGANMSGDLKDPRTAIPRGTLTSIGVTMFIYIVLAFLLSRLATPQELRSNQMIIVDKAFWAPAVLAGIMGATLSSALGSMVGAPRILQALAARKSVPAYKFFAKKTDNNEPRNAVIFTGAIILVALLLGNLDVLASLITMFFLVTYGMLNFVVFLQQSLKIISFRPTFKIPRFVPLLGALGCISIMFLIDPVFSIIAFVIIIAIYVYLERQGLKSNWGDIRGGLFLALAERMSRMAARFPRHQITWKPDLLLPIDEPSVWAGSLLFIRSLTFPNGSIFSFTVKNENVEETQKALEELMQPLKQEGLMVNCTVLEDIEFLHGTRLAIQTLRAGTFKPNIIFLTLGSDKKKQESIAGIVQECRKNQMGTVILRQHPRMAFGMQHNLNLWLRDKSPNWHLAMLLALQLQLNWGGKINLVTVAQDEADKRKMYGFLERLANQARLPSFTDLYVLTGKFEEALKNAPKVDINIFGLSEQVDFDMIRKTAELTNSSCLFVQDSGQENALV